MELTEFEKTYLRTADKISQQKPGATVVDIARALHEFLPELRYNRRFVATTAELLRYYGYIRVRDNVVTLTELGQEEIKI